MTGGALSSRLTEFVSALRAKGIYAGTSETVDAASVIELLGMSDREQLREGLASALVRRDGQRDVFDAVFDLYFPATVGASQQPGPTDFGQLREQLLHAIATGDDANLDRLAMSAVDMLGEISGDSRGGWSAHQTLRELQPQQLISQAAGLRSHASGTGALSSAQQAEHIARNEVRGSVERFRHHVEGHARRRTAEVRSRESVTRLAVSPGAEYADFLNANASELAALRHAIHPLARKLATRLNIRRRRERRGRIDVRRTVRRSVSTGGIPVSLAYQKPRPTRPELVLVCDVSGSVAGFSQFTMLLVKALADQFKRVRVFAFVNAMDEVTDLISSGNGGMLERIHREARITGWHTSSDYGEAFGDLLADDAIGQRTSVVILGDARNNNQDPNLAALSAIRQRARRIYWLNPETAVRWGFGDSVAPEYAGIVDMYECRNLGQLTNFVTQVMPVR